MILNKHTANDQWIYTYDYAPDQIWEPWRKTEETPEWIFSEALKVSEKVKMLTTERSLSFALLTDSHYVINGTWVDTRVALAQLNQQIDLEGVIHLGDFTDGMVSRQLTEKYVSEVFDDFKTIGLKCHATLGNHDCNYFKNNPERLTIEEQCRLYLCGEQPRYYIDYEWAKLRLVFIDSYDPNEPLRYGFSTECIDWLNQLLSSTLNDYRVIIFSHLTPLVDLQVWAKELRHSDEIMSVLRKHSEKILAYINGHNHCDHLHNEENFPIISLNCAKCEYFLEHKPQGARVPSRSLGDVTQECFDIMTIDATNRTIHFTRYGAGVDRIVKNGKAEWL